MGDDYLSRVLDLLDARGAVTGGFVATGSWTTHTPILAPIKLIAVAQGRGRVYTDGVAEPVELRAGDVAVLNGRHWITMTGGHSGPPEQIEPEPGFAFATRPRTPDHDVVIGGHVELNAEGREMLLQALPPLGVIRADGPSDHPVQNLLERLLAEVDRAQPGSEFAARHYAHLVILEVLRASLDQTAPSPGWLQLVADPSLRPAVRLIHGEPGQPWRISDLAHAAQTSRTVFIERFRTAAGIPPLQYLTKWRMLLAQRALSTSDKPVAILARELGYGSAAAFSTAYKREVGQSPERYRKSAHDRRRMLPE